ncbi:MAG: hypothetical protein ABI165_06010, partial [Bryobacteraceae bacterium]
MLLLTGIEAEAFSILQRYIMTAERMWRHAFKELQQTQGRRKKAAPAPAGIGSVSQNAAAHPAPAPTARPP